MKDHTDNPYGALVGPTVPAPEDIDAAWLGQALARAGIETRLDSVSVEPVGSGQLGETFRFRLTGDGPGTIVGKFASRDAGSRGIAAHWHLYEREVGFYRWLADRARIRVPVCLGTAMDDGGAFYLLMQDCKARSGDQIAGMSAEDAGAAMREAARLHAAFWDCGKDPDFAWLETGPLAQPFYSADILRGAWPGFRERFQDLLTADMIRVCDRLAANYEAYARPLDRPRCVTHNDYRPDNMLFPEQGGLVVVDWQSAALGHNAVDVAYMIGGGFAPEDRRAAEAGLLDIYHRELTEGGVAGYSRADLEADYRHFSFAGINVAVGAGMMVKRTERGDRMFMTLLSRHVQHVLDTDALEIVQ